MCGTSKSAEEEERGCVDHGAWRGRGERRDVEDALRGPNPEMDLTMDWL
jgi:hypothetical protein